MVFSLCDVGPAGRMHPWDGAGPDFSTSSPGIWHESSEDESRRASPDVPSLRGAAEPPRRLSDASRAFENAPDAALSGVGQSGQHGLTPPFVDLIGDMNVLGGRH